MANYNLDKLDIAEKSAQQVLRLDSDHIFPKAFLILANVLVKKNDVGSAIVLLRQYLKYAPDASEAADICLFLREQERLSNVAAK
jgi:hypothetical protein